MCLKYRYLYFKYSYLNTDISNYEIEMVYI